MSNGNYVELFKHKNVDLCNKLGIKNDINS